jgi:HAD superfamily hydrolase (TIGR01509 family)
MLSVPEALNQVTKGGAFAPPLVVFDLDGTLAESVQGLRTLFYDFLEAHIIADGPALFERLAGRSIPEILHVVRAEYGLADAPETLVAEYNDRLRDFYAKVQPMPGADAMLAALSGAGHALGLGTSADQSTIMPFLRRTGWTNLLQVIACGNEVAHGKPSPDVFLLARDRAGGGPMIVVEDSSAGIEAGVAAGARVIGFAPEGGESNLLASGAEAVVIDLRDIPALVASWTVLQTTN